MQFLATIQNTAEDILSKPNLAKVKKNSIPGWLDYVKPAKDDAVFWNSVWISCGKPIGTEVHNIMKRTRNKYHYQIRICKKNADYIKKTKLIEACSNQNVDLFDELKKLRTSKPVAASMIDGVSDNVETYFGMKYSDLYNSANDEDATLKAYDEICDKVNCESLKDVDLITNELMKESVERLKDNKTDAIFNYSTDCFKYGGECLIKPLVMLFKSCLIHRYVPDFLMLATLVPIVKDKIGNINDSKNYRSIAISNILLKIFDWIFIMISGDKLKLDDLQFAYQEKASTTMCSWMVMETISYFLARGSNVYACSTDYSKAFDRVLHGKLFMKMLKKGFSTIFLRLLMFVYINQTVNVRWRDKLSERFRMTNAVRQGAVSSAILYCFYCEELFQELKRRKSGCWIGNLYLGILGYSDDNFLLSPNIDALQDMIKTCESFAKEHNLQFSTDPDPVKCKTKLIAFSKTSNLKPNANINLCGSILPWVNNIKHVGNNIESIIDGMQKDIQIKEAMYIEKVNSLQQELHFAHPSTLWKLNMIYNFNFTGCELWDLSSPSFSKFMSTVSKSFKILFDLPYATHKYFYEAITTQHAALIIKKRFKICQF